jgi:hypothetical protein
MGQLSDFSGAWPADCSVRERWRQKRTEKESNEMPNQSTGDVGPPATAAEPQAIENGSAAVLVFVAGMAAGVVLGLMLAPTSGASLRRGVGRRLREGADWTKSKATEAKQEFLTQSAGLRDGIKAAAAVKRG